MCIIYIHGGDPGKLSDWLPITRYHHLKYQLQLKTKGNVVRVWSQLWKASGKSTIKFYADLSPAFSLSNSFEDLDILFLVQWGNHLYKWLFSLQMQLCNGTWFSELPLFFKSIQKDYMEVFVDYKCVPILFVTLLCIQLWYKYNLYIFLNSLSLYYSWHAILY